MSEREKQPVLPEEKFAAQVEGRSATWLAMVTDKKSPLSDEDKQKAKDLINDVKKVKIARPNDLLDCVVNLVMNLQEIFKEYKKDKDTEALMDNLKQDIWDFYHELNNI